MEINKGWRLFFKAFGASKRGSLAGAADWMFRLNVFSRNIGSHPIKTQIYMLKNDFIRYLYQHGYSTEVILQKQEFPCWGTWQDGCTDDCPKCGGTGIYRTERLYGFRFLINGVKYGWHQPAKLINYEVKLTDPQVAEFTLPRKDHAILNLDDAWLGACVIWWYLLLHGMRSHLILFDSTYHYWGNKIGVSKIITEFMRNIRYTVRSLRVSFVDWKQNHCKHVFNDTLDDFRNCKSCGIPRWKVIIDEDPDEDLCPF